MKQNITTAGLKKNLYRLARIYPEATTSRPDLTRQLTMLVEQYASAAAAADVEIDWQELVVSIVADYGETGRELESVVMARADDSVVVHELSVKDTKVRAQRRVAGVFSAEEQAQRRKPHWDRWQAEAARLWSINPSLNKSDVIRRIMEMPSETAAYSTIGKRISHPENE